jgi:hypothetical protein
LFTAKSIVGGREREGNVDDSLKSMVGGLEEVEREENLDDSLKSMVGGLEEVETEGSVLLITCQSTVDVS